MKDVNKFVIDVKEQREQEGSKECHVYFKKKKSAAKTDSTYASHPWYVKTINNPERATPPVHQATREVVAQELLRLIDPYQPKTRIGYDAHTGRYYALSKAIIGFQSFFSMQHTHTHHSIKSALESGVWQGFGNVLIKSLWLNECDLSLQNLGINPEQQVIKLDGEWSFTDLEPATQGMTQNQFSTQDIQALPFLCDYLPVNWFDIVNRGDGTPQCLDEIDLETAISARSKYFDRKFADHPQFREEINSTLLKIIVLSDELLTAFVQAYTDNDTLLTHTVIKRTRALEIVAMKDEQFQKFLISDAAKIGMQHYQQQLAQFCPMGKTTLLSSFSTPILENMAERFQQLRNNVMSQSPTSMTCYNP